MATPIKGLEIANQNGISSLKGSVLCLCARIVFKDSVYFFDPFATTAHA